jgi:hypothetical protein
MGSEGIAPHSFTFLSLYHLRKSSRYPLYEKLDDSQSCSGNCGEDKNLIPLPGIEAEFRIHSSPKLFAVPTKLLRLQSKSVINLNTVLILIRLYATQLYKDR